MNDDCCTDGETRAALVGVSPSGLALRRLSFRSVLDGEARPLDDLARQAGASADEAAELALRDLVMLDAAGRVVGAAGLSLEPIRQHRLHLRGRAFWTWCAIDAVGIPSALAEDADVETTCHHCAERVHLRFRGGRVAEASRPDARLWNAEHVPGRSMARGTCSLMNLFCSEAHLDAWRTANPDAVGVVVDLDGAAALGRQWWGPLLDGPKGEPMDTVLILDADDPVGVALASAIRSGDLPTLSRLLMEHPGLANARLSDGKGCQRTPLHVAADWPGHYPRGAAVVAALVAAGADPNARVGGAGHAETPLHWAASSDDTEVADALIVAGGDLEATGASIAGGTPLDDAVGYGCWQVARLLVDRGARVDKLWHAAALGLTERVATWFAGPDRPSAEEVNQAFWQACHGGQRRAAEYLLGQGADPGWVPRYSQHTALEVAGAADGRRERLVAWLRDQSAIAGSSS